MSRFIGAPPPIREVLVPCEPGDPDMELVYTDGFSTAVHRPWSLTWEQPMNDPDRAGKQRKDFAQKVRLGSDFRTDFPLPTKTANGKILTLGTLTQHQRLSIRAWIADCQARAHSWSATQGLPPA